jgi:hypothetical protein
MATIDLTPVQTAFLQNYLDAEIPGDDPTDQLFAEIDLEAAGISDIYMMGRQTAAASIAALQAELEQHDDPNAERIAKFGLLGLTGGNHVQIMQAILDYENAAAPDRPAKAATLLAAFDALEEHLSGSALVALVEDNASNTPVSIRAPLNAAIATIRRKIGA